MTPYRTLAEQPTENEDLPVSAGPGCPDADLAPFLFPFWLISVARVTVGIVRQENPGLDASLAIMAVVLVPLLLKDTAVWCLRRMDALVRAA